MFNDMFCEMDGTAYENSITPCDMDDLDADWIPNLDQRNSTRNSQSAETPLVSPMVANLQVDTANGPEDHRYRRNTK